MLKVVHVQNDMMSAGRAALRLHLAFEEFGIESSIITLFTDVNDTNRIFNPGKIARLRALLDRKVQTYLFRKTDKKYGSYSYPIFGTNISKLPQIKEADIIYIHWVLAGFFNLSSYEEIARLGKPIIIYMHDMWTITGGCHHSFSCEKYKTHCANCQVFPRKTVIDWAKHEFNKKLKIYDSLGNLFFVSPSRWLYNCAKQSALTRNKPVWYIPNILDTTIFQAINKKTARKILNINEEEIIIAFSAFSVNSPFKGWIELQGSLEILKETRGVDDISILITGSSSANLNNGVLPFKTKFLGFLKDEYSMSLVFNAADVFVAPSLAETFGYVIMESLSCGTPVVAFEVGGISDQITHKNNGYLAKYRNAEDLANGIRFCLEERLGGYLLPGFERATIIKKHVELIEYVTGLKEY